jgi:DNA invertase Pin-like site-specific DNA recombinase
MSGARLRCAIYTRKSSEEGLDQDFNSLDAQREACEAYVSSQRGEGWLALANRYDDGGFSGGNMERPGLSRLLADIDAGRIDVVVVYKVDRLTRSLSDFARIVDRFDKRSVSFVSVTQAFNTTTSMGRLTLNVLLSFAQFEREVTGERIRDKIAASKAKGMWMGGNPPLGYLPHDRSLRVDPDEAITIRWIFERYLELGSVHALRQEMKARGIVSRRRTSAAGRSTGGHPFSRGAVFHLLRNRVYVGEIVHGAKVWPGLHPPIVDRDVFDRVQAMLDQNATPRRERAKRSAALLTGLIRDGAGEPMSPVTARKGDAVYRYYVAAHLQQGRPGRAGEGLLRRVAAAPVEQLVANALRELIGEPLAEWSALRELISAVHLHSDRAVLMLTLAARARAIHDVPPVDDDGSTRLVVPARLQTRGGRSWLEAGQQQDRRRVDRTLVSGLRRAHRELAQVGINPAGHTRLWRDAEGIHDSYLKGLVRLAFLAPDIQQAIMEGRQPVGLTLQSLRDGDIPLSWTAQRKALGFAA